MNSTKMSLEDEVRQLAEQAYHLHLISGYGEGPERGEYQLVCQGKPKHFSYEEARSLLKNMLKETDSSEEA
ncbi:MULTISPECIES: hypothetical protein [unclassified Coleofasciculus]|uniref:hypothetical protein n=1 Tax=unclassified Coleofasciculus TaxID=2692782 RepID=UPI00187F1B82|nr:MULTISPECIES: hypothetical protein [unclassified Coleofasciculus]MBE9127165.1 hypothetical protein [Coleofasciculus sp. LEGE 07081]MBE9150486.1 hypothetical protein [Coleofasciculus sp. LEGE 07092]